MVSYSFVLCSLLFFLCSFFSSIIVICCGTTTVCMKGLIHGNYGHIYTIPNRVTLFPSTLESGTFHIGWVFGEFSTFDCIKYGVTRMFVCYYCWIIANNFGLHIVQSQQLIALLTLWRAGEEGVHCYKGKSLRGGLYSTFPGPLFTSYCITFYNSTELLCLHYNGEVFIPAQKPFQCTGCPQKNENY